MHFCCCKKVPLINCFLLSLLSLFFFSGCEGPAKWQAGVRTVEVVKVGDEFRLLRYGKPYFIKGAGAFSHFEELKEAGGNSIRIWSTNDAGHVLDQAHEHGLTVNLGVWITREKEGFNYDDKKEVDRQFEHVKRQVLKYKDHPALLMWSIGNEMNKGATNLRMWDSLNEIAEMIHTIDPNHPVTTAFMDVPQRIIKIVKERCPHLDILSFNTYGALATVSEEIEKSVWEGPYIISEFGSKGYWEVEETSWGASFEPTSSEKARFIQEKYEKFILTNKDKCLGSYAFLWGYKPEKTHTWFSYFSEEGEKTEAVDVFHYLWEGKQPDNFAPKVNSLRVKEGLDINNLIVWPGDTITTEIEAFDPEGDSLSYHWEVFPDVELDDGAVDRVKKPDPVPGRILSADGARVRWIPPVEKGDYRLFVKVTDGNNNMAGANIPLHVGDIQRDEVSEIQPNGRNYFQRLLNSLLPE